MDAMIVYPATTQELSLLQAFVKDTKMRFSIKKEKKKDDSLFTKEAYFAMLDERIKSAEQGNTVAYTPELEKELFGKIL